MNLCNKNWQVDADCPSSLVIQQSFWGLQTENEASIEKLQSYELLAKVFGLILPSLGALIFLTGPSIGLERGLSGALPSLSLALLGWWLYSWAAKGFINELHIDGKRRSVLLGTRCSHGVLHVNKFYEFDDIVSVFIRRSKNREALVTLNVTTQKENAHVRILRGTEVALLPVLEYFVQQHARTRKENHRVRTKTTGRWIHARFS